MAVPVMLSIDTTSDSPVNMVTAHRYQRDGAAAEHSSYHVVLKPTPQRLHGSVRGPAENRPRAAANFTSIGTGAFTAYVPASGRQQHGVDPALPPLAPLVRSGHGDDTTHALPPDLEYTCSRELQPPLRVGPAPRRFYPTRPVEPESPLSEANEQDRSSDVSDQGQSYGRYPIDLRNDAKKLESAQHGDRLSNLSPNQGSSASVRRPNSTTVHESEPGQLPLKKRLVTERGEGVSGSYSLLNGITSGSVYSNISPRVEAFPRYRHESVIMKNSPQESSRNSQESAEYMRYTCRSDTARAEVFEMKRSYSPLNGGLSHFAETSGPDNAVERSSDGTNASPDASGPPDGLPGGSCSYDSDEDEEIDVVSDDYLQPNENTDEDERYTAEDGDDSESCEAQALDCRVSADRRSNVASPTSSDTRSGNQATSGSLPESPEDEEEKAGAWRRCEVDPQDTEASWGVFTVEDLLLRNRVLVVLWSLLGEGRLLEVGYPRAPVHRILWLTVDVCCSVAGMKSAAAVPLTSDHDCFEDMLCFRDHTHRFLEVCAPTRDMWKQFGWAGLTVDAVVRKIYEEELRPRLSKFPMDKFPPVIQRALLRLDRLEEMLELAGGGDVKISLPPVGTAAAAKLLPAEDRPAGGAGHQAAATKKKRGRPAKINQKTDPGRIERVMLWRFLLNLLEDPRNKPCIHWVQREEGIFRILNTDWLARLWGRRHGNPRMTYEKMARAMRTYYRSKVLQPVPRTRNLPRKLIYKFNPAVIHKVSSNKYAPFSDRGLNYNTTPGS